MEEVITLKLLRDLTKFLNLTLFARKAEICLSQELITELVRRGIKDFMCLEESEQLEKEQSF